MIDKKDSDDDDTPPIRILLEGSGLQSSKNIKRMPGSNSLFLFTVKTDRCAGYERAKREERRISFADNLWLSGLWGVHHHQK